MVQTTILVSALVLGILPADRVTPPPKNLRLDAFYKKFVDLDGLPIVSSEKVPDAALLEAQKLGKIMLKNLPQARKAMIRNGTRIAIMAESEVTVDIPEHSDLYKAFPGTDWNTRARGLGATLERPAVSAAEENLLRYTSDRYKGESIFIHEFAHAIMDMGLAHTDKSFLPELNRCFDDAKKKGLWNKTYAASSISEYWAETVQSYFDANRRADPPNGVHNNVANPAELKAYDPEVYKLIRRVLGPTEYSWQQDRSGSSNNKSTLNH